MWFTWMPYARAVPPPEYTETPVVLRVSADRATLRQAVAELSMPGLEDAWSLTDAQLASRISSTRRSALIDLRALVLDEVERRSPRRYRKWLRRGGPHSRHTTSLWVILG
jgi:hypothetical protein